MKRGKPERSHDSSFSCSRCGEAFRWRCWINKSFVFYWCSCDELPKKKKRLSK